MFSHAKIIGPFTGNVIDYKVCRQSVLTLVGGARVRLPSRLELTEVSLTSDATLAESESRSSLDPPTLLEGLKDGLRFKPPVI